MKESIRNLFRLIYMGSSIKAWLFTGFLVICFSSWFVADLRERKYLILNLGFGVLAAFLTSSFCYLFTVIKDPIVKPTEDEESYVQFYEKEMEKKRVELFYAVCAAFIVGVPIPSVFRLLGDYIIILPMYLMFSGFSLVGIGCAVAFFIKLKDLQKLKNIAVSEPVIFSFISKAHDSVKYNLTHQSEKNLTASLYRKTLRPMFERYRNLSANDLKHEWRLRGGTNKRTGWAGQGQSLSDAMLKAARDYSWEKQEEEHRNAFDEFLSRHKVEPYILRRLQNALQTGFSDGSIYTSYWRNIKDEHWMRIIQFQREIDKLTVEELRERLEARLYFDQYRQEKQGQKTLPSGYDTPSLIFDYYWEDLKEHLVASEYNSRLSNEDLYQEQHETELAKLKEQQKVSASSDQRLKIDEAIIGHQIELERASALENLAPLIAARRTGRCFTSENPPTNEEERERLRVHYQKLLLIAQGQRQLYEGMKPQTLTADGEHGRSTIDRYAQIIVDCSVINHSR